MAYQNMGMMRPQLQLQNSVAPGRNNSQYTGNPQGVYNSRPQFNSVGQQQQNLGRYVPPTYSMGSNNQPQWANQGGYEYNVPNSYGGPGNYYGMQGQGYGRQGMPQGYGAGGGGYFGNQYAQPQRPTFTQSYGGYAGPQQWTGGNPYNTGELPSILASYGGGETQGQQGGRIDNKGAAPIRPELQGMINDLGSTQGSLGQDIQPMFNNARRGYAASGSLGSNRGLGGRPGLFQNGYGGGQYADPSMPIYDPMALIY